MTRGLTAAEAVAGSLVTAVAAAAISAYLLNSIGASIAPVPVLIFSLVTGAAACYRWWPIGPLPTGSRSDLLIFAAVVATVFGALVWLAWPELLPLGGGSDLTHHLQLVDFIDRRWHLARTAADAMLIGNMVNYTPGFHLVASLAGAWGRTDGLHAVYVVLAASVAVKSGLVFLIARRTLTSADGERVEARAADAPAALAIAAVALLFLPDDYLIGSFARFSFLSQVLSEMFAVAMWMALAAWYVRQSAAAAVLFGVAGAAAFLTWPVFVGPPILVLAGGVLLVTARNVSSSIRLRHAALALVPIALVAVVHASGRIESVAIVRSGGSAFEPAIARFGWLFVALASAGAVIAFIDRRATMTAWLLAAVGLQTAALFVVAYVSQADSPYLALKMLHFAIYPMAVAGALTLDWVFYAVRRLLPSRWQASLVVPAATWLVIIGSSVAVARRFVAIRRPPPAITEDLFRAGQFARANAQPDCIEYLVPQDSTSYWLYLAVLGNPSHPRSGTLPSIFVYQEALVRWITRSSYPVTIADLSVVPREVRDDADVLAQFGQIIVGRRRGSSGCGK